MIKPYITILALFLLAMTNTSGQTFKIEHEINPDGSVGRGRKENSQKEGLWVSYDQQGNPRRFEEFKEGKRHGFFLENDDHGHPFLDGWFFEGKPVGKHTTYNHGTIARIKDFDTDSLLEYHDNGALKRRAKVIDGQAQGTVMMYYDNGNPLSEVSYSNGKKNGVQRFYYITGKLQAEYTVVDDTLHGSYKDYHDNGNTATEGAYEKNLRQGVWKEYDENGKSIKQTRYKNDKEIK